MRVLYGEYKVAQHNVTNFTLENSQLVFRVDSRAKIENGTIKSNNNNMTFDCYIDFPFPLQLSYYNVITIWVTITDNLSPSFVLLGNNIGTLVPGVSTPLTYNGNVVVNNSTTSMLTITFSGANVIAGITIDKIEAKRVEIYEQSMPRIRTKTTNSLLVGHGTKLVQYPMLENYYIEGTVSVKGIPLNGAILKIHHNNTTGTIIPTSPNGRYLHYINVSIPATLIAYSLNHNYNSIVKDNVRPNSQFRSQIGKFTYN